MEIIESTPPTKVVLKIDFIKPMEGHNTIEFTLVRHDGATTVTHTMQGPSPHISRLMTIFFSMDKMLGAKFSEGLANLKVIAEK